MIVTLGIETTQALGIFAKADPYLYQAAWLAVFAEPLRIAIVQGGAFGNGIRATVRGIEAAAKRVSGGGDIEGTLADLVRAARGVSQPVVKAFVSRVKAFPEWALQAADNEINFQASRLRPSWLVGALAAAAGLVGVVRVVAELGGGAPAASAAGAGAHELLWHALLGLARYASLCAGAIAAFRYGTGSREGFDDDRESLIGSLETLKEVVDAQAAQAGAVGEP